MKKHLSISLFMLIALLMTGALGFSAQRVQAQLPDPWIFRVNTFEDMRDFAHNGVCSAGEAVDGPCSLRAALHEASYHGVGNAIIELPPGVYKLTLDKPSFDGEEEEHYGDLDIPGIDNPRTGTLIKKAQAIWTIHPSLTPTISTGFLKLEKTKLLHWRTWCYETGLQPKQFLVAKKAEAFLLRMQT